MPLLSSFARAALRGLGRSLRIEVVGAAHPESLRARGRPALFAVWHGRMLLPVLDRRDTGIVAMISLSRDGELATRTLAGLGYRSVRGSSSERGRAALDELVESLRAGSDGAIIPDGPRGPARILKPGILMSAQRAGAAIVPIGAAARPALRLRSWDRFLLPLPFARGVVVYGAPFEVPPGADLEALRTCLEGRLSDLEVEADRLCHGRGAESALAV